MLLHYFIINHFIFIYMIILLHIYIIILLQLPNRYCGNILASGIFCKTIDNKKKLADPEGNGRTEIRW